MKYLLAYPPPPYHLTSFLDITVFMSIWKRNTYRQCPIPEKISWSGWGTILSEIRQYLNTDSRFLGSRSGRFWISWWVMKIYVIIISVPKQIWWKMRLWIVFNVVIIIGNLRHFHPMRISTIIMFRIGAIGCQNWWWRFERLCVWNWAGIFRADSSGSYSWIFWWFFKTWPWWGKGEPRW